MYALRHGDVVLLKVDEKLGFRGAWKPTSKKQEVLAEGELTGHSHRLQVLDSTQDLQITRAATEWVEDAIAWLIEVPAGGAELVHEEHNRLEVSPGKWVAFQQREAWTDPNARSWRSRAVFD